MMTFNEKVEGGKLGAGTKKKLRGDGGGGGAATVRAQSDSTRCAFGLAA